MEKAKICDAGLIHMHKLSLKVNEKCEELYYLAPEVMLNLSNVHWLNDNCLASDLFSLGVIVYQMMVMDNTY